MPRRLLALVFATLVFTFVVACGDRDTAATVPTSPAPAQSLAAEPTATNAPAAVSAPARAAARPATAQLGQAESNEPSGERARRHVQALAGVIGPRVAGSDGERAAADYIAAQFQAAGLEVLRQPFKETRWTARHASFEVTAPTAQTIRVAALEPSVGGTASGELFFAGLGYPNDYPSGGIRGKIALVERGQIDFVVKARNAAEAGASALVLFDANRDVVPGTLYPPIPNIPALTIPGADGKRLRDLTQTGPVRVSLTFEGGTEELTYTNVIARTPATTRCEVVVGGHYDTVASAPGGSDNASGTAAVLELARVETFAGRADGVCFIAFSGEEEGLLGSKFYLRDLSEQDRQAIRLMLNFDMVAVGDEWAWIGTRALQCQAVRIASELAVTSRPIDLVGASSDHAPFISRRIPALMLHRIDDRLLHTPEDTADRITAEPLDTAVRLGTALLRELNPAAESCP